MTDESYSAFIEAIDFNKIEVVSLECKQNEEFKAEGKMLDIFLNHSIEKATMNGVDIDVKVGFDVFAYKSLEDTKNDPSKIEAEEKLFEVKFILKLKYNLDLEKDEKTLIDITNNQDFINIFVDRNVPINVWPYAREIISNVTMKMGFPPLMIPPYKSDFPFKG